MEQFQQANFEMHEQLNTLSSSVQQVVAGAKTTVDEKFAIAEIQFRAEQNQVATQLQKLQLLIDALDNEELRQVAARTQHMRTHEEVRSDILRKMFTDEANLVRG